jgi:Uma2 family endonuclease
MFILMMLEVLTRPDIAEPLRQVLGEKGATVSRNGTGGEERWVMSGVSWESYQELDSALGEDRPEPRLYYLDGELEIMTTSLMHERLKEWLGTLVEDYLFEAGIETFPHGQATLRRLREAGAEPDKSWCFGDEKEHPDLVVEIALTSGGLDKLEIYRRFSIPEVWLWRKQHVEIRLLSPDGYTGPVEESILLPNLDIALLERCLAMTSWRSARQIFRQGCREKKP